MHFFIKTIASIMIIAITQASCSHKSKQQDTATDDITDTGIDTDDGDCISPPDVMPDDPGRDAGDFDHDDDVVWQECEAPSDLDTYIQGPGGADDTDVSIDATGTIAAISADDDGRWTLEVDFSASDPELGTGSFTLPPGVGDRTGLTEDDVIHVNYHFSMWFWTKSCLVITREGTTLLAAASNDWSCAPIENPSSFQVVDLTFTSEISDCEPLVDDCASWRRGYLDVTCGDLTEPLRILDGSETDVPCGSGYHVSLGIYMRYYREISPCSDQPGLLFSILVTPD